MKRILRHGALLLCATVMALTAGPAAAEQAPKFKTDRTIIYFGAPW